MTRSMKFLQMHIVGAVQIVPPNDCSLGVTEANIEGSAFVYWRPQKLWPEPKPRHVCHILDITYLWKLAAANILGTRFFLSRHSCSNTFSWQNFVHKLVLNFSVEYTQEQNSREKNPNFQGWNCCTVLALCLHFFKQMTMDLGFLLWPGCMQRCLGMGATMS